MQGAAVCERHQRTATLSCPGCGARYCYSCVQHVWSEKKVAGQCPACKVILEPCGPGRGEGASGLSRFGSFLAQLPLVLIYPLRSSVLLALALLSGLSWLMWFYLPQSQASVLISMLIMGGLSWAVYFNMIEHTACGEEGLPLRSLLGIVGPIIWILAAHLPIMAGSVWLTMVAGHTWAERVRLDDISFAVLEAHPGPAALILLGVLLLPMLLALAALTRSFVAILNPANWWRVLRIMGITYLFAAGAFYALYLAEIFLYEPYVKAQVPLLLEAPALATLAVYFLGYVPMAIQARLLGAMCRPYLDRF